MCVCGKAVGITAAQWESQRGCAVGMYWTTRTSNQQQSNSTGKSVEELVCPMYVRANDANNMDVSCADFQHRLRPLASSTPQAQSSAVPPATRLILPNQKADPLYGLFFHTVYQCWPQYRSNGRLQLTSTCPMVISMCK